MPFQGKVTRYWRYVAVVTLAIVLVAELASPVAATIVPGTPDAASTPPPDTTPEADNSEIAPELPPADLPSISQQGYSYDLTATLRTDLDSIPKQTPIYTVTREVTSKTLGSAPSWLSKARTAGARMGTAVSSFLPISPSTSLKKQ